MKIKPKVNFGFSLVELMTVIVIIGVLAAIATPAYRQYITRSRMAEAYQTLGTMTTLQKSYFSATGSFATVPLNGTGGGNSILGGETFTAMAEWKDLGYPIAPGEKTIFSYSASAGKTDSSGTPICNDPSCDDNSSDGLQPANSFMHGIREFMSYPGVTGKQCGIPGATLTPEFFGVNAATPSYDWVVMYGKGNLTPGEGTNCNVVMQILEATNGVPYISKGIISFTSNTVPSEIIEDDDVPVDEG